MWQNVTYTIVTKRHKHILGGDYMPKNFAELRREAGYLKQNDLSKVLNVDRSTVAKWESGTRYPLTQKLTLLSKLLNCTEGDIIVAIDNAPKTQQRKSQKS